LQREDFQRRESPGERERQRKERGERDLGFEREAQREERPRRVDIIIIITCHCPLRHY